MKEKNNLKQTTFYHTIYKLMVATIASIFKALFLICLVTDWMLDRDPQEEVFKAFRLFDDDDSGKISLRNLRRVARELGENMTDEELRAMIDEFDKDGDGESEFLSNLLAACFSVACRAVLFCFNF